MSLLFTERHVAKLSPDEAVGYVTSSITVKTWELNHANDIKAYYEKYLALAPTPRIKKALTRATNKYNHKLSELKALTNLLAELLK